MKAIKTFFTFVVVLVSMNVHAQWIELTTQEQVDKLTSIHFAGEVKITTSPGQDTASMITDLTPLSNLDSLERLAIENTILTNLDGLQNVSKVFYGLNISDNPNLEDITALNGIEKVGRLGQGAMIVVESNPSLKQIPSFSELKLARSLSIVNNASVESFNFSPKRAANAHLGVRENVGLTNFTCVNVRGTSASGNSNLQSFYAELDTTQTSLYIYNNPKLYEVFGFNNVNEIGVLKVHNNPELYEMCFLKRALLRGDTSVGYIDSLGGNGQGANSIEEILAQDCSNWNSVEDNFWVGGFSVFPNPTSSTLNINFEQAQEASVGIYSLTGALLIERQFNTQNAQLDVSGLPEGMYVVQVKTGQGVESQKVVISR